jgi:hypothetical protein
MCAAAVDLVVDRLLRRVLGVGHALRRRGKHRVLLDRYVVLHHFYAAMLAVLLGLDGAVPRAP